MARRCRSFGSNTHCALGGRTTGREAERKLLAEWIHACFASKLASDHDFVVVSRPLHNLTCPVTLRRMITVESDEREIRVTIPRGELEVAQVEAILRPFRFASLVAGSQMSRDEALRIAEESKADWWEKNGTSFAPPEP